jgi:O-antigen/teichoic acid export membrane protein
MGGGLPLVVGVVSIPFAIKGLGKDGFGILSIAWVVLGYFGMFDFGLSQATTKYSSEALAKGETINFCRIFWTAILVSFGLGLVGTSMLIVVTPYLVEHLLKVPAGLIAAARYSFILLAFSLPVVLCSSSVRGVLGAAQRFDLINKVQLPLSISTFLIPGLSYPFSLSLTSVVGLMILSRIAAGAIYIHLCFKLFPDLKHNIRMDFKTLKTMLSFGGWISITNIVSPLLVYMDRFFIGSFISITSVAFYTAPYEMVIRMRLFPNAIMEALFPEFSAASVIKNDGRVESLFARSMKYISLLMGIVVILLIYFASDILRIWLGTEFAATSVNVLKILSIGVFFNALATVPFILLLGVGRPDIPAKFHIIELTFYIIALIFLVKHFGINGAALAWSLRVFLDAILLYGASMKRFPLIYSKFKENRNIFVFKFLGVMGISLIFIEMLVKQSLLRLVFFILISLLAALIFGEYLVDKSERAYLKSIFQKMF